MRSRIEESDLERTLASRVSALERQLRQLSCDVHDQLGAEAIGIRINLDGALEELLRAIEGRVDIKELRSAAERMELARAGISDLYGKLRNIQTSIYPEALKIGFSIALRGLLSERKNWGQITCTAETEQRLELIRDSDSQLCVYRFIQEALNNADKYSGDARVVIEARDLDGDLLVVVADSGPGFPEAVLAGQRDGMGLSGLLFRARQVQGEFSMGNGVHETHAGACVCLRVPGRFVVKG